ncbi:hypothetical protein [Streptomyces europaeiscabiei]|uniref:hypothetical protein n=1 Tax=Streptomyces europaeiscabiei TaxID=146819 RepID=UPI002E1945F5
MRDRLKLHTENRVHPKADEWRNKQLDRAQIYIRSLWSRVLAGDEKAINAAIRTEERIAKLLGLDSATAFKVEVEQTDDRTAFLDMLLDYQARQGRDTTKTQTEAAALEQAKAEGKPLPPRRRRPTPDWYLEKERKEAEARQAAHTPDEFPNATPAGQVQEHTQQPQEEFEPAPRPRTKKPAPNPSLQFLRDSDDD